MSELFKNVNNYDDSELIIPSSFEDAMSYVQDLIWLYIHKQDKLVEGSNVQLINNPDGTVTISVVGSTEFEGRGISSIVGHVDETGTTVTVTLTDGSTQDFFVERGLQGIQGEQGEQGVPGLDGADGVSPEVTITDITDGHRVTITDAEHPSGQSFDVTNGIDGVDGADGIDGTDGVSPEITITNITDGHRVTITDAEHPSGQSFDVMNGVNGTDGTDGVDGTNGTDGVSPEVEITEITDGHRVTITDAEHPSGQSFDVMNGANGERGHIGPQGNSVWTAEGASSISITPEGDTIYGFDVLDLSGGADRYPRVGDLIFDNENVGEMVAAEIITVYGSTVTAKKFALISGPQGPRGEAGVPGNYIWFTSTYVDHYEDSQYGDMFIFNTDSLTGYDEGRRSLELYDLILYREPSKLYITCIQYMTLAQDTCGASVFQVIESGVNGTDGADGVSPEVTITNITDGHRVTITDAEHPSGQSFDVMDGSVGATGPQGPAGPQGATGPQGPAGNDGTNGTDGTDGVSPEVTITNITDGHRVTITDAIHPLGQSFDIMDGADGAAGPQGPQGPTGETGPQGPQGPAGTNGTNGVGVPTAGTTGQVLAKASNTDYDTEWITPSSGGGYGRLTYDLYDENNSFMVEVIDRDGSVIMGGPTYKPQSYDHPTLTFGVFDDGSSITNVGMTEYTPLIVKTSRWRRKLTFNNMLGQLMSDLARIEFNIPEADQYIDPSSTYIPRYNDHFYTIMPGFCQYWDNNNYQHFQPCTIEFERMPNPNPPATGMYAGNVTMNIYFPILDNVTAGGFDMEIYY